MSNIVLGVSGSVAAYRACDLARDFMRAGHTVRVCLTDAASNFVQPALFEALTGQPCLTDTFEEPVPGRMAHIDWARAADLIVVAPATANSINKVANGIGDDMLATILLASTAPILIAPAMNPAMYNHPETQASLKKLASRGVHIVEPTEGEVACGENGQGKLANNAHILREALEFLNQSKTLEGKTILITSGPTQEPIDTVRFISNRSSGKMGLAMARAARLLGAEVILVSGPTDLLVPSDIQVVPVVTASEMLTAAQKHASKSDWIIGLAAVADYSVAQPANTKLRRTTDDLQITLTPNPDIIGTLAKEFPDKKLIAFAAEPSADPAYATEKMQRKGVSAIALNDISRSDIGFGSDDNELTLITADGKTHQSGKQSKLACSLWMLKLLAQD